MTGTGVAAGATEFGELHVEIRTVNGRSLQLKQRLCAEVAGLEPAFDEAIKKLVQRGTVTLVVERRGAALLPFDRSALRAFVAELRALARELDLQDDVSLRDVLALAGGARAAGLAREMTPQLQALLQRALDALQQHRAADGRATVAAVRAELDCTRRCCDEAARRAPQIVVEHRARLQQRLGEFLATQGLALDAAAVVREVAMFSERVDVGEELQRLRAHCDEIEALLAQGGAIGRKLDFLLQEALREANTLGSKSPDVAMAHGVVAMKTAIDRMKEQAANLE